MAKYILRRLILTIPVIFGILLLTFAMLRMVPGDPCRAILGERATDEICDPFLERMGRDLFDPFSTW
jgi:peptide/nickel transport system permease protein